ncbi:hypothetical protein [Streptomyces sp. UNOC14_S4]|uniref:hypothetical protein n=1 Tax=Streptomyces sp. UNOC14_S4 TaxID=2872340 RepID=UPI001E359ACC|nr:hypothetical protein [Streptomyces sp. UNOC14_S4]MCC3770752.1 hypothetical protein [Streptomyces sp. UNOC14_S4]
MTTVTADRHALRLVHIRPPAELTGEREQWLVDGLTAALPSLRMRELFALRRDMFRSAGLITVAVGPDGNAVGALASRRDRLPSGAQLLHATTQFVAEGLRHTGVFRASWGAHFAALGHTADDLPLLIALKTYNPVVLCGMRAFTRIPGTSLYPDCTGAPQDRAHAERAARIAALLAPGHPFDPATGVISGIGIPPDLYPRLPRCRDEAVNAHFARATRPGDRVLCVFDVGTRAGAAALLRAFGAATAATAATGTGGAAR